MEITTPALILSCRFDQMIFSMIIDLFLAQIHTRSVLAHRETHQTNQLFASQIVWIWYLVFGIWMQFEWWHKRRKKKKKLWKWPQINCLLLAVRHKLSKHSVIVSVTAIFYRFI